MYLNKILFVFLHKHTGCNHHIFCFWACFLNIFSGHKIVFYNLTLNSCIACNLLCNNFIFEENQIVSYCVVANHIVINIPINYFSIIFTITNSYIRTFCFKGYNIFSLSHSFPLAFQIIVSFYTVARSVISLSPYLSPYSHRWDMDKQLHKQKKLNPSNLIGRSFST